MTRQQPRTEPDPGSGSSSELRRTSTAVLLALLIASTTISYIDRQTLSIAAPVLRSEFGISNFAYSEVLFAFLLAYALFSPLMGRLIDNIGTRLGLSLAVLFWSIASALHAAVRGVLSLALFRFLLGVGEAGNFPGCVKAIAETIPPESRSLAAGVFNIGAGLGAIVAPPLVVWLILTWGWRAAFVATSSLGMIWVFAWSLAHRDSWLRAPSVAGIVSNSPIGPTPQWKTLLRHRPVWALMTGRFIADPAWYFYLFWLPEYLHSARGLDLQQIGYFAWVPFLSADLGSLSGGALGTVLMRRGWTLNGARKTSMATCAVCMPLTIVAAYSSSVPMTIAFISLATFAHQAWTANILALPADLFPPQAVASVYGITALASGLGAMMFMLFVGWTVDHFSYTSVFIAVGLLHPAATAIVFTMIPELQPVRFTAVAATESAKGILHKGQLM